jgi:hypothetical protein
MLRVSKVEGWLTRPRAGERDSARPEPRADRGRVIIRAGQQGPAWQSGPRTARVAANRGEVTAIAVVTLTEPASDAPAVVIELPRHLADLVTLPVAHQE